MIFLKYMFKRLLSMPQLPKNSFFLWGPRQVGKSFLMKHLYPNTPRIDLLDTDQYIRYLQRPSLLREECLTQSKQKLWIIDEIQKSPLLLDEVHYLIENHGITFGLCGSSARKLKRGHANLLGGRALRYELYGLVAKELAKKFDLEKILNRGYLPNHYQSEFYEKLIHSYVNDYLKNEIAAEGIVRNLPTFSNFLRAASFLDTEIVNFSNIASDSGASSPTIREYFQILEDTLLGSFLPAYIKRQKRKTIQAPKFYFFDVGIVNYLAKRGKIQKGSELFGKAFENWVYHEIKSYLSYQEVNTDFSYWRLRNQYEVDFILGDMEIAIEVKSTATIHSRHVKNLYELLKEYPRVKQCYIVCLETKARLIQNKILVLPYQDFIQKLWDGEIISK